MNEIEMTFLANPGGMNVVLEADKRGGFLSEGHDALTLFTIGHNDSRDWNADVDGWIRQLVEQRASHGPGVAAARRRRSVAGGAGSSCGVARAAAVAMSGIPWWNTDIGGFASGDPDDPAYRELLIRWFQYRTFSPVMRLHGDREPTSPPSPWT